MLQVLWEAVLKGSEKQKMIARKKKRLRKQRQYSKQEIRATLSREKIYWKITKRIRK
jgi:hypothetical protein